jgi:hypothetical protein
MNLSSQNGGIKILRPTVGEEIDFDTKGKIADRAAYLAENRDNLTSAELKELELINETNSEEDLYVWEVNWGCSWYCGAGSCEETASSSLKPSGKMKYDAGNAHDLNLKTAWVEGVPGHGIGEYLTYVFENKSPRITTILIYNGYVKSKAVWKNNSRVRSLKMYVNGKPYAVLQLKDTWACQSFDLGEKLGRTADGKDLVLKFEITDVYPGDKYEDTAITELFFDGVDVHCVGKGTQILMNDNSLKNIEDINSGDIVKSYDTSGKQYIASTVKKVHKVIHSELLKLKLEGNTEIITTEEHPFLLKDKSWSSYSPQKSRQRQLFVNQYQVGDLFVLRTESGIKYAKLLKIETIKSEDTETYTLELKNGNNFIGNNFIIREE